MRWKSRPKPAKLNTGLIGWLGSMEKRHERKQREWLARVTQWHKWWAWHPILIEGTWVVWEYVHRKGKEVGGHCGYGGMDWEYRTL